MGEFVRLVDKILSRLLALLDLCGSGSKILNSLVESIGHTAILDLNKLHKLGPGVGVGFKFSSEIDESESPLNPYGNN